MTALSKKKAAVTRSTGEPQRRSRLTESFGGVLQSTVKGPGMTPSVTYQPFSVLQLARAFSRLSLFCTSLVENQQA